MRILAIDTALSDVSAAVSAEPGHIESESFRHERDALQRLAGVVSAVLQRSGLRPADINLVVVTRGPGSFTGLRVGVAAARAFAAGVGASMAGPSTLQMLAESKGDSGKTIVPLVESCPGELYRAAYLLGEIGEDATVIAPDGLCAASDLPDWISSLGCRQILAVGPALPKYASYLGDAAAEAEPTGVNIARVVEWGRRRALKGRTCSHLEFQPEYLRASQAELRRRDAGE